MIYLFITAAIVGGATVIGAVLGLLFEELAERYSGYIISFAAGIMLAAAVIGLIVPATEGLQGIRLLEIGGGILLGALTLYLIERLFPYEVGCGAARSAILCSLAIAIHNLPEGIAAGVAYGGATPDGSLGVIVGIALHNLPEGMIAITPLLASGVGRGRAFLLAISGAVAEVVGTVIGFSAVRISVAILPFTLSFAGGTMLAVVAGEMIPEASTCGRRRSTVTLIVGFSLLVMISALLG